MPGRAAETISDNWSYFITAQAAGADVTANATAVKHNAFPLEVDAPAPFGAMMRVAKLEAHLWSTIANHTYSRHFQTSKIEPM